MPTSIGLQDISLTSKLVPPTLPPIAPQRTSEEFMLTATERYPSLDLSLLRLNETDTGPEITALFSTLAQTLQASTERSLHRLTYVYRQLRGLESRHTIWNAREVVADFIDVRHFGEANAISEDVCQDIIEQLLARNWETFLDEATSWKTPVYDYTRFGLPHGYLRSMEYMGETFVTDRKTKGGTTLRAEVEGNNMQRLINWMSQPHEVGTQLYWFSSRGSREAGYPGTKLENPNMINIYTQAEPTPDNPNGIKYQQFKSWMTPDEIPAFHQSILQHGQLLEGCFPRTTTLPKEVEIIDQLIELPPKHPINWETQIYANESNWAITRSEYPVLEVEAFYAFRQQVFEEYLNQIQPTLYQAFYDQQQENSAYWNSANYQKALKILDTHFLSCAESIFKWTEDFDQRPIKTQPQDYLTKFRRRMKPLKRVSLTAEENLDLLRERMNLQTRIINGEELNSEDIKRLGEIKGAFKIINRAASLGQCGLLAPITLTINAAGNPSLELGGISLSSQKEQLTQLETYIRLDLPGAKEIYMVPPSYLEAPGCRVVTEGPNKGEVEGPCGLLLSNPLENGIVFTESQWLAAKHQLTQAIETAKLEQLVLPKNATSEETQHFHDLIDRLTTRLFSNSLNYLFSGIPELTTAAYQLPYNLFEHLQTSTNRLATLEEIVMSIETGQESRFSSHTHSSDGNVSDHHDLLEAIAA